MNNSISADINSAMEFLRRFAREDLQTQDSTKQLLLEVKCTNSLQMLIDIVNTRILRSFSLRLQMECNDDSPYVDFTNIGLINQGLTVPRENSNG
jgi:hypothetical protein